MCEIFEEGAVLAKIDGYYQSPKSIDRVFLSQLFLILALGLSFATPQNGGYEKQIVDKLRQIRPDQSQAFYFTAMQLHDPTANPGQPDFRSLQTLTCMTLYLAIHMKRETAFIYCGRHYLLMYKVSC